MLGETPNLALKYLPKIDLLFNVDICFGKVIPFIGCVPSSSIIISVPSSQITEISLPCGGKKYGWVLKKSVYSGNHASPTLTLPCEMAPV